MLDVALLRDNRVFLFSGLAALIHYCATAGSGFLLSLYLQYVKGLAPREAGLVLLIQPVFQTIVAPFAGRLSDRVEPRIVASTGMALTAAGLAVLIGIGPDTQVAMILACLVLLGIGFGLFSSPNTNAVMSSVDRSRYGVASATVGTMRVTGQVFSMGIVTMLLAVHLGGSAVTPERVPGFIATARYSYSIFAVLCVIGIFASLARGRVRPDQP
jgi:MFS family permease